MTADRDRIVHLTAARVSLVVDLRPDVPVVLHWGAELGTLSDSALESLAETGGTAWLQGSPDTPRVFSLLPTELEAWSGIPAIAGHRAGNATTPRPRTVAATVEQSDQRGAGSSSTSPTTCPDSRSGSRSSCPSTGSSSCSPR